MTSKALARISTVEDAAIDIRSTIDSNILTFVFMTTTLSLKIYLMEMQSHVTLIYRFMEYPV